MRRWLLLGAIVGPLNPAPLGAAERVDPASWVATPGLDRTLAAIHASAPSHDERLVDLSALFVGRPYADSPLGEGPGGRVDSDPVARFDRFDCVTFVEEVMALARQPHLESAVGELQRIRYAGGVVRYGARNHLMIAQWLPRNIEAGFVRDVTADVAGPFVEQAVVDLRDEDFLRSRTPPIVLEPADRPIGSHQVPIVPLGQLATVLAAIPHGTILSTVRTPRPGSLHRITHLGLMLVVDGRRIVRHAHRGLGRVVEQSMTSYLSSALRPQRWPIVGFNMVAIVAPSPAAVTPTP